jgi:hypothetical protein
MLIMNLLFLRLSEELCGWRFIIPFRNREIAAKQTLNGLAMSRTATIMRTNGIPTTLGPGANCNSRKKPGYSSKNQSEGEKGK